MFKNLTSTYKLEFLIPWLIILLVITAESATDMYAPNLPDMVDYFKIKESLGQLTISLNLLGLSLSGLIYGPLSDVFGRKKVILTGLAIFCLGSWGSYCATDIEELLFMRLVQGMGAGVSVAVGMAVIQDVFTGNKMAQIMSRLGMAIALSPGLAPMVGTVLAEWRGWQTVFLFVFLLGVFTLLLFNFFMPETLILKKTEKFSLKTLSLGYRNLFRNKKYVRFSFIQCLTIGWLWGHMGNLPFIFVNGVGLTTKAFAIHMMMSVLIYCVGAMINQRLVLKWGPQKLLKAGLYLVLLEGILLTGFSFIMPLGLWSFIALNAFGALGLAYILPNAPSKALEAVPSQAGAGSALMGSLQLLFGSLGTIVVGLFYNKTFQPLGIVVLVTGLLCLGILKEEEKN